MLKILASEFSKISECNVECVKNLSFVSRWNAVGELLGLFEFFCVFEVSFVELRLLPRAGNVWGMTFLRFMSDHKALLVENSHYFTVEL